MINWKRAALSGSLVAAQLAAAATQAQAALVVSSGKTQNVTCAAGVCTATAAQAVMNATTLRSMLAASDVTLVAGSGANDIVVSAATFWASAHTLSLDAFHSIQVNKTVSSAGEGGMTLTTNHGGTGGTLGFAYNGNISFLSLASPVTINGHAYTLVGNLGSLASAVATGPTGRYALAANYDASVDGVYATAPVPVPLLGAFEGLGNKIDGLAITAAGVGDVVGLFATIGSGAVVDNARLTHLKISAGSRKGLVANVGGLAGSNAGTIQNALVSGSVRGSNATLAGGIAGANTGSIIRSNSGATVSGVDAGGIAGENTGTITSSFATHPVRAVGSAATLAAGGLVGANLLGTITKSYATGAVSGIALSTLGGLVGNNTGSITNTYAKGAVSGNVSSPTGGLVGVDLGTISQSYATGQVTGGTGASLGGFVGEDLTLIILPGISSSYWDTTTSGIANLGQGAGNRSNDPGITGLSDVQLKAALPSGFSTTVWSQSGAVNAGLPYLLELPPA